MTHEITRGGQTVDIWGELGPAENLPVRSFNVVRPRASTPSRKITVVLQKGHCFRSRGSTGAPGEQDFNNHVVDAAADAAAGFIEQVGHKAHIVLADDRRYPVGDIFFAQHYDGSTNTSANGASVGYDALAGQAVAARWKSAYRDLGWTRGFRADNYTRGLSRYYGYSRARAAGIPARLVIEAGFGSNRGDREWLDSDRGRTACAAAICIAATGINPLTGKPPTPPTEDDMTLPEILRFIQAEGTPVFLANILDGTRQGIETHNERVGLATLYGISADVVQVDRSVIEHFDVRAGARA